MRLFVAGFTLGVLSVSVLLWWTGAFHPVRVSAGAARIERAPLERAPIKVQPRATRATSTGPIGMPIANLDRKNIQDTFEETRGGSRKHEAADILAPRGTPVLAMVDGIIQKLFTSKPGGLTIYEFDKDGVYCYYYAHLDSYAEMLKEGMTVRQGDVIGYVGTTGNAPAETPHLHLAIFRLGPEKHWWQGAPINPYPILMAIKR